MGDILEGRTRKRVYWNDGWGFSEEYEDAMQEGTYPGERLRRVRLPHTTAETPYHYFDESIYQKVSGYRRVFTPDNAWQGKSVRMTVEAAAHQAQVFLNGRSIITHHCGYTAFTVELSPYIKWEEENVLVIRVDSRESLNIPPFGNVIDYMTYGGLYREVYLDICEAVYIRDVFPKVKNVTHRDDVSPNTVSRGSGAGEDVLFGTGEIGDALLICEVSLAAVNKTVLGTSREDAGLPAGMRLEQSLWDLEGRLVAEFPAGELEHRVERIRLWDTTHPELYLLKTALWEGDRLVDEYSLRMGFREITFEADGLYLNGKKEKLRGLNRHQSFPYVGYAMPKSMQRRDAEILKWELGLNAVRTSHYPQSHAFLDRCDELGLLVFTEIPGWQHIGDEQWKEQVIRNTEEMVTQYRNHPSIFLWGVRINESLDDDILYRRTNDAAHKLDDTRPTSGVRYLQKSSLLEDVYAYNDFSHDGGNAGCMKREKVIPDAGKGYLISEYNGHMFPTKSFDCEDHRTEHMLRHARVMDAWYAQEGIAGGFGWCMFDYNTHKDFGSGDRICYHGVLDMFRNPKLAASLYAAQTEADEGDVVLEISSSMDIGEHPACLMKEIYAVTNGDSVRVYKNDKFVGEFHKSRTPYRHLPHGPILIDDFIGGLMEKEEGFSHGKAEDVKRILMAANKYGLANLPPKILLLAVKCMVFRGMKMQDAVELYNKYVGNWGGTSTVYRFEAIKDGKVAAVVEKRPMERVLLQVDVSHTVLREESTYDVAAVRIQAVSETGNKLPFYQEALHMEVAGDIMLIGPEYTVLRGGMGGTYVKSKGKAGAGILKISGVDLETVEIGFTVVLSEG